MTTTTTKQSNALVFKTSKTIGNETIHVTIRLNDECKNGHQDFAITGNLFEADKPKTDRYHISSGCIHEEIQKFFPEFLPFIKLHLCDWEGIPMHAVANGFYHLRNGFNNTKPEDKNFKAEFCEYYRITPEQFDVLNESINQLRYALRLENLGILAQWKKEANEAIEYLENLTDTKFVVDSVKSQLDKPTDAQFKEEEERIKSGYYTPEAQAERARQRQNKILAGLEADRDKEIKKANDEFEVKKQVLLIGGESALNNCIYYNHSQTLAFNWKGYDRISEELINKIVAEIQLPDGVKIENKEKK